MNSVMRILLRLKAAYSINTVLYALRRIPGLKKLLTVDWYKKKWLKRLMIVLSAIWEMLKFLLIHLSYFAVLMAAALKIFNSVEPVSSFLTMYLALSAVGLITNSLVIQGSKEKYYAVVLMRMNAVRFAESDLIVSSLLFLTGQWLSFFLLFFILDLPLYLKVLLPLGVWGLKLLYLNLYLSYYRRHKESWKAGWPVMIFTFVMTAAPMILLLAGIGIPVSAAGWIAGFGIAAGLLSLVPIKRFPYYPQMLKQMFSEVALLRLDVVTRRQNDKLISEDNRIESRKQGLEYLNELFVKRHRKVLWKPALIMTGIVAVLLAGLTVVLLFVPKARPGYLEFAESHIAVFTMVAYLMNRGTAFTKALFDNCDHSLLAYSSYRKRENLLKLFRIRLKDLIKVNLLPTGILGVGCALLYLFFAGGKSLTVAAALVLTVPLLSIFFSIHYMMLYYVLQPFTEGSMRAGGLYSLILMITYWPCYATTSLEIKTTLFSAGVTVFVVVYFMISMILVYRMAPKKFRIH